jgi:riboflavin biosynthesis pyrimidine reductase
VDEFILYIAPVLLGADAAPLTGLTAAGGGADGARGGRTESGFEIVDTQRFAADVRLILRPRGAAAS